MNTTVRRLMKEAQELSASSSSPSPHFHAHPISDSNFFDWHFTLVGPPEPSPYANGLYHGRIVLPPQYPLRPPSFRFLTPSGRFEVNREICLSISGHHEETWQPAWGIRTALTAIRSFMEGDANGQIGGIDAKEETRREWAKRSREWKCDVCAQTNQEIIEEWWGVCKEKGVNVHEEATAGTDGAGKDILPAGLKVGYKDELGAKSKENTPEIKETSSDNANSASTTSSTQISTSTSTTTSTPTPNNTPSQTSRDSPPNLAADIPSQSQSSTPTPTQTTNSTPAIRNNPPPTRQQTGTAQAEEASTSPDGLWLDRAIVAVVIALVIMILKHFAGDEAA
ncbi:hypothetical protein FQN55_000848 [Onygenales sp. PD_40]|nr:hypothetical protein FQN55_000848 [Onygenales sp. PD_40]KAK2776982.1 hypothetical protein FQN53_002448 [Emmonsiellopsis sp. PD_33]